MPNRHAYVQVAELERAKIGEILVVEPHFNALPTLLEGFGLPFADFDRATERAGIPVLRVDHDGVKDKIVVDIRGAW